MDTSAERMRRMRERRRAGLQPDPDAPLRSADELVSPALEESLTALDLKPEDAAAVALARAYARTLDTARDAAWACRWIAPLYLSCLESLHATPMSRAKAKKDPGPRVPGQLGKLRMARRTGLDHLI